MVLGMKLMWCVMLFTLYVYADPYDMVDGKTVTNVDISKSGNSGLNKKLVTLRKKRISSHEEQEEIELLKKVFEQGSWITYIKHSVTTVMRRYCQEAYKSYLQDLILLRLHDLNEITDATLNRQLEHTNHKCKLCIAAIKIADDPHFVQKYGHKFIYREAR